MQRKTLKTLTALAALAASSFGSAAVAQAAGHHHNGRSNEVALTGTDLSSAESAAVAANPGATANSASTETDSSLSGAKYEVKITKADGSKAVSIEDASFNVLATNADTGHRGRGRNGETPLTGTDLSSAESAAVAANPGATANSASTETDSSLSGAKYEVKITKADGSKAVSIEDASFNVLATNADTGHRG